jgi:hypothetical protein
MEGWSSMRFCNMVERTVEPGAMVLVLGCYENTIAFAAKSTGPRLPVE